VTPAHPQHSERGFTLVELMISLVLFSIAVAGVLSVAVSLTQGYREQRQAMAAESSVRAPLDFLSDALRQGSPGVSDPNLLQDFHTCKIGAVEVTNSASGPDELDLFYATGGVVTSTASVFDTSSTSITVTSATQLSAGDYVIVTDFTNGMLVKIESLAGNVLTLGAKCSAGSSLIWPTTGNFPLGSIVIRAQHAHFEIQTVDGLPTLTMDPDGEALNGGGTAGWEPLAEGIEDMQIAVGVDADGLDGISEIGSGQGDDEWYYNVAGEAGPPVDKAIRAVRVTLIARTTTALFGNTTSFYYRPEAEDHAAGSSDNYRRRVLRSIVEMRNIGGSP
jgi:prepilin-type N-terminal cleavage/methylation domain-containing protein